MTSFKKSNFCGVHPHPPSFIMSQGVPPLSKIKDIINERPPKTMSERKDIKEPWNEDSWSQKHIFEYHQKFFLLRHKLLRIKSQQHHKKNMDSWVSKCLRLIFWRFAVGFVVMASPFRLYDHKKSEDKNERYRRTSKNIISQRHRETCDIFIIFYVTQFGFSVCAVCVYLEGLLWFLFVWFGYF